MTNDASYYEIVVDTRVDENDFKTKPVSVINCNSKNAKRWATDYVK